MVIIIFMIMCSYPVLVYESLLFLHGIVMRVLLSWSL